MSGIRWLGGDKYEVELSEEELAKWQVDHQPQKPSFSLWAKRHVHHDAIRNAKVLDLHLQALPTAQSRISWA